MKYYRNYTAGFLCVLCLGCVLFFTGCNVLNTKCYGVVQMTPEDYFVQETNYKTCTDYSLLFNECEQWTTELRWMGYAMLKSSTNLTCNILGSYSTISSQYAMMNTQLKYETNKNYNIYFDETTQTCFQHGLIWSMPWFYLWCGYVLLFSCLMYVLFVMTKRCGGVVHIIQNGYNNLKHSYYVQVQNKDTTKDTNTEKEKEMSNISTTFNV